MAGRVEPCSSPPSPPPPCPFLCLPCTTHPKGPWGRFSLLKRRPWVRGRREPECLTTTRLGHEEQVDSQSHVAAATCTCRKCSLISLGDVNKEEVHNMIKFIKQNKVLAASMTNLSR